MIKDIKELNFPQYATLSQATCTLQDMAEKTITTQVKIDGEVTPDFSYDWEVEFKGEKYIMPLRQPQGVKENISLSSVIDLTFHHWAVYQLKRWYFFTVQPVESGTAVPDEYIASVSLNLGDFCELFSQVLEYYYGDTITIDLNPQYKYDIEPTSVAINHSYIWDVLIKFHELWGVRWAIAPKDDIDHYVIKVGYPTTELSHIFEYGFEGGLLKVERQVQDENIRNMIIGRGGDKNLPYRYFKEEDSENKGFEADPDWVPELANMYFSELRGATYRSYIQGWKTKHYGSASVAEASKAYAPWAWEKGYTDEKFNPVEFVKDDASIRRYGKLMGGLENNEDIYPTIQGVVVNPLGRIDEAVAVEKITSDDVEESAENDAQIRTLDSVKSASLRLNNNATRIFSLDGNFSVSAGKTANLIIDALTAEGTEPNESKKNKVVTALLDLATGKDNSAANESIVLSNPSIVVTDAASGTRLSASGIPEGSYRYQVTVEVQNTSGKTLNITVAASTVKVQEATLSGKWTDTWDIWVKNLWGSAKLPGETEEQYAERVWRPILGDREGNEAKVVFSDGWLSTSEDYEFTIVKTPVFDDSKSLDGVPSHWRITLAKSDADLKSLGLYVPSTKRQAEAGDHFFFIGIDMPHQYVLWAEERLDNWKKDYLREVSDIKPTWVVRLDKIRISQKDIYEPDTKAYIALEKLGLLRLEKGGAVMLETSGMTEIINRLAPGVSLRLADKRFILNENGTPAAYENLYLQSVTFTYNEPTVSSPALIPDVEIVLSDKYETIANPVSVLQGEVSNLTKQIGSISGMEQLIRVIGDRLYLRKDGIADRSMSPTEFASLVTSMGFRSGIVGGKGWGFFKDENGNWVLETDRLNIRQDMQVNNLVINQIVTRGGMIIESAAQMEMTRVESTAGGYICYFDQKGGSVANLFHKDDVAYCNRFTPENAELKFYKRRVIAVAEDNVTLSDTDVNGKGIPSEGDVIAHFGNYTDKNRQYVKIRDVIGGGYERYLEGLDSVNAEGVEYYFVGRQDGNSPRWFIGHLDEEPGSGKGDGSYIEYKDGRLSLNNVTLSLTSKLGDKTFEEAFKELTGSDYLRKALAQSTEIAGGLVLTSLIQLGVGTGEGERIAYSGISGLYDPEKTGGGIAAFYGGDMVDMADYYDWDETLLQWILKPGAEVDGLRIAKGVDRMDGTGYRAGGNFWWDASGNVHADPLSFFVGEDTVGNVLALFRFFPTNNRPFESTTSVRPMRPFTELRIGTPDGTKGVTLVYDVDNDALRMQGNVYADGDVTAMGPPDSENDPGGSVINLYYGNWVDYNPVLDADLAVSGKSGKLLFDLIMAKGDFDPTKLGTLTIQRNGVTIGSYNPTQASAINISVPIKVSDLTNDVGYLNSLSFGQEFKVSDPAGLNSGAGVAFDLISTMTLKMPSTLSGVTSINGNGSALYIGNPNNSSYIYISEDIRSTSGNPSWSIALDGTASFASVTANAFNGNATSATRLKDAFTLWGQTFYGNNVSGDMYGVGSISMSGNITLKGAGNYGNKINFGDGDYVYLYESEDDVLSIHANKGIKLLDATEIGGNVGIGKVPTAFELDVNGSVRATDLFATNSVQADNGIIAKSSLYGGLWIYGGTNYYLARIHAFGASPGWSQDERWLDINNDRTTHFYHSVYSDGDITALGTLSQSDMRLKNIVRHIALDLDMIASAPLFIHTWKNKDDGEYIGSSAQYWKNVFPQFVRGDNILALDYGKTALAASISIAKETRSLKERVAVLEKENRKLKMSLNIKI